MEKSLFLFFEFFWFIAAAINCLNFLIFRSNFKKVHKKVYKNDAVEVKKFVFGALILSVLPLLLLGILQQAGGYNHPLFVFSSDINITVVLSWLVIFISGLTMLYCVFFTEAVDFFTKYYYQLQWLRNITGFKNVAKVLSALVFAVSIASIVLGVYFDLSHEMEALLENLS